MEFDELPGTVWACLFDMTLVVAMEAFFSVEVNVVLAVVGHELREIHPVVIANVCGECDGNGSGVRRSHIASRHGSIFTGFDVTHQDRPVHGHRGYRIVR